jgi:two-component system, sensor histidine kinase and response regulator
MAIESDITERKRGAAALQASEQQYRSLVGSLREVVFQTDPNGRLSFLNPAWERITGFAIERSLGEPLLSFLHPDEQLRFRKLIADVRLQRQDSFLEECRFRTAAQRFIWMEFSARLTVDKAGVTGTLNDISERRRTAQVMLEAARAAEASNRAKSDFLAMMSHEIRTPMNGVLGMSSLLLATAPDPEQQEFVDAIDASAKALLKIINDILDFSKIEAGKLSIEQELFDLSVVINGVVELETPHANRRAIGLQSSIDPQIAAPLQGDAGRLRQILLNLVNNALKFSERGLIDLSARLLEQGDRQVRLRFEVRDDGPGISPEMQDTLFRPFTQLDATPSRKFGGTGLGLAICQKLVKLMGGEIGVTSSPGKGSLFWFTLPFEAPPSGSAADKPPDGRLQRTKVHLVIQRTELRDFRASALESWSIAWETRTELATLTPAALAAEVPPAGHHILLVEQSLVTAQEAARIKATLPCKLVLVTNLGDLPEQRDELDALFDAYLVVPVSRSQLFDCLTGLVGEVVDSTEPDPAPPAPGTAPERAADTDPHRPDPTRQTGRILLA